jgi:FkbH-like protein
MKLIDALQIVSAEGNRELPVLPVGLVCGFTPLHFQTFLEANLRLANRGQRTEIIAGLYGDFWGNLEKLNVWNDSVKFNLATIVLEWSDLDARLGLRGLGSWAPSALPGIIENARARATQFVTTVERVSQEMPVAICFPTLPVPPISYTPGWQSNSFVLELRSIISGLSLDLVRMRNVRVVDPQRLDLLSPHGGRHDVKAELLWGFPYKLPHASVLAELLTRLVSPPAPKKAIITDLDDTLWGGILGEVGLQGISWDLENKTYIHGAYQRFLHALSEAGVLIGVASKNDPHLVYQALAREDLILPGHAVFPVEAGWGPKSQAVERILRIWNITSDAVVFIDDSPMELAEVKAQHPEIEALLFPANDYFAMNELFDRLRDLFGRSSISQEDSLRRDSIRRAQETAPAGSVHSVDNFLEQSEAQFFFDSRKDQADDRAFDLINKTNQFNLNGRRITEAGWQRFLKEGDTFLLTVTYQDKYGPLGKIAVVAGRIVDKALQVDHWVMSCRAFSRRIEHRTLEELIRRFEVQEVLFAFEQTSRNSPLREFLEQLLSGEPTLNCRVSQYKLHEFLSKTLPRVAELPHG